MIKKTLNIISVGLTLTALVSIASYYFLSKYLKQPLEVPHLIFIPKGTTYNVYKSLQKNSIDLGKLDYYLIKAYGYPQAGWIEFKELNTTRENFYHHITHSKAALKDITLIPGETTYIFFRDISLKYDLNSTKLNDSYNKLISFKDGVIIPDTYKFPLGISEDEIIKFLVDESLKIHRKLSKKHLNKYDEKEWFSKYISKASVIQKEAADVTEMSIISAVIDNRLKKNMKLQMDGTLNYGKYSHVKVTKERIREDMSPYNTYKIDGLPSSPVCSVSKDAIIAALKPDRVNYLYFVKLKNGKHKFNKTYKKHLYYINQIKNGK
jgi:UPF0755 protein